MVSFEQMKQMIKEIILYGVGGGIALSLNVFLTYILTEKIKIFYLFSAILGYSLSLIFNFVFQSFITFKSDTNFILKKFTKFIVIQLSGLAFYSFLVFSFTHFLEFHYLISVIISSAIVFLYNFIFSKFFVFKINKNFT